MEPRSVKDLGLKIGDLPRGPRNALADVAGVRVGHATRDEGAVRTGVTAILPHGGDPFRDKPMAAVHVVNGFGKSVGLVQVEELGTIETPILLTNTFAVGICATALIRRAIRDNPEIGRATSTVNPLVFECNDGYLSDIQALAVTEDDAFAAIDGAVEDFAQGDVGAGKGMSCYGLKGGIGSASRVLKIGGERFALGALVLSNFGHMKDLRVDGRPVGARIARGEGEPDKGSAIAILATDLPLDALQLRRLARRAPIGLHRTGSFMGHGSGEIVLAFTTRNRVAHDDRAVSRPVERLSDGHLDVCFRAAAWATEEATLNSMLAAGSVEGRDGHMRRALSDCAAALKN